MVDLAWKILLHDKARFLITVSGAAFAVTLVFVQVGLLEGLLANASITIEQAGANLWITGRNTPNVDFANTFPETDVQRVCSIPGVLRADNLIVWFGRFALHSGATENTVLYALADFTRWNIPWRVDSGDARDPRRGKYMILDASAAKRFGPFAVGDYREILGQHLKIIGKTIEARSFTTNPIAFVNFRVAQSLDRQDLHNRTTYILAKLAPGADSQAVREAIRARLIAAIAEQDRQEALIAKTRIIAPIDGVVTARHAHPGETIEAAARIFTIADLSRVRAEAEVDEFDASRIAFNAPVVVTAEGHANMSWQGIIEEIPDSVVPRRIRPEDPGRPIDARVLPVKISLNAASESKSRSQAGQESDGDA